MRTGVAMHRALLDLRLGLALVSAIAVSAQPAYAIDPVPSFRYLVTGNGHGYQIYDVGANAVKQYLERPYRYIRANPSNPDGEGIVRRNLAFDTYFGVKAGSTAAWLGGRAPSEVGYVDQSNMIRSAVTVGGVLTESFFVSPFGYEGNALVMLLKVTNTSASAQSVTAYSIHNFKMGSAPNPDAPDSNSEAIAWDTGSQSATENGPGGGVIVYAPIGGADVSSCNANAYTTVANGGTLTMQASCNGSDQKNAFAKDLGSIPAGESRWWGVTILFDADGNANTARTAWSTFLAGKTAEQLYTSVLAEMEAWRKAPAPGMSPTETRVWRQAETVLRMGQIRESYVESPRRKNHGMILASLPPGGWHTGWVRDAVYAIVPLARTGHAEEARMGLDFFLNADAGRYASFLNNVPYRISTVRYFGDGQEEADYSGAPTRNIEIDGWGLVLWAARVYVDYSADIAWLSKATKKGDTVYDAIKNGIAEPLIANLEPSGIAIADASIWEVHWGNRQHFLYTTAATARGLCDMATIARRAGKTDDVARYRMYAEKVTMAMRQNFVDSNRVLAGSLERLATGNNYRDGATVEAFTWSLIPATDPIATATLGAMSYLQTPAGGYKRVEGSNDQYDTDEWILIDLRASAAFRRAGNGPKADQLLNWVTAQASVNYDLAPELYNTRTSSGQIGAYSGSIPMVGYGAGAYQMTMLDRVQLYEHSDCGEKDLNEYPDAGPVLPTDGGNNGGGNNFGGRTGIACACQGGPGSAGNAVLLAVVGLLVLRRRRTR
jgi:MYXO-CTERM domain-containing protein